MDDLQDDVQSQITGAGSRIITILEEFCLNELLGRQRAKVKITKAARGLPRMQCWSRRTKRQRRRPLRRIVRLALFPIIHEHLRESDFFFIFTNN